MCIRQLTSIRYSEATGRLKLSILVFRDPAETLDFSENKNIKECVGPGYKSISILHFS